MAKDFATKELRLIVIHNIGEPVLFDIMDHEMNVIDKKFENLKRDNEFLASKFEQLKKEIEEKDRKLKKCYEIMGNDINHCPKGYDCLYDEWMQERDCHKCWERYIDRLAKQGKLG